MHAKYEVSISYGSKVIAKVKVDNRQTNRQTDRQTGQKQYAPDHSIRGHKKTTNKKPKFLMQQNWETEVLIESENVIGNQDDSEQAVPQKDINVKDANVCGDMLPKVVDKLKSVKMEGFLVKLLTLICSDLFPFESICFILFQRSYIGNLKYSLLCCITIFYGFLIFVTYTFM